jgi:nitrogen fixation/metabolism regulation signal transduction histidine kinase
VDEITRGAEQITSRNLSQRLPIAKTGDQLERLSAALNRMIGGWKSRFYTSAASPRMRRTSCARRSPF